MANRTNRHLAQQHGVAWLNVGLFAGNNNVAYGKTLWCKDVGQFAIFVLYKCDEGRTVGVIFQTLNGCRHIPFTTLKVDQTIFLLMTAADTARSHVTLVVTAAGLALTFGQSLNRTAFVEARPVNQHKAATGGASWFVAFECHYPALKYRWSRQCSGLRPK